MMSSKPTSTKRTYPQGAVPTSCAKRHPVCTDTQTADTVLVASEYADALALQGVPDIASPVVVAAEQNTSRNRESDGRDSTEDVVVCERVQFAVGPDIEQPAGSVIGSSGESIAIREKAEN